MKQALTRASQELFRRTPDESFATLDELWANCQTQQERSRDLWEMPDDLEAAADGGRLALRIGGREGLDEGGVQANHGQPAGAPGRGHPARVDHARTRGYVAKGDRRAGDGEWRRRNGNHEEARPGDGGYLRVANVQDGWLDLDHITEVEVLPEQVARYTLQIGDVLLTEGGDLDKLGRGYVYAGQIEGCLHQNHIFAVRPHAAKLDSSFLASVLSSTHGRNYFTKTGQKTTNLASTNSTKLGAFPIPLPPVIEQRQIMSWVAQVSNKLDALTAAADTAIARLDEYRQSLITSAVTGKIDVRRDA